MCLVRFPSQITMLPVNGENVCVNSHVRMLSISFPFEFFFCYFRTVIRLHEVKADMENRKLQKTPNEKGGKALKNKRVRGRKIERNG